MIIDASALVAIVIRETGHELLTAALANSDFNRIGAPTLLETGIVLEARSGARGRTSLARLVDESQIETVPFSAEHAQFALDAFTRFGKGRHPAALNFGDCCCYATAAIAGEPLLCVGNDFAKTDLELVPLAR